MEQSLYSNFKFQISNIKYFLRRNSSARGGSHGRAPDSAQLDIVFLINKLVQSRASTGGKEMTDRTPNNKLLRPSFLVGQMLIELLVAIGLTTILLPALLTGIVASREGKASESQRLEATALLKEAEEAVRSVREKGWANIPSSGIYHPQIAVDNSWSLAANSELVNGYTRQITISDVNRDPASLNIVESGGTPDSSTKKVVSTVSWTTPLPQKVESTSYFQRYLGNTVFSHTSETDFNGGTHNNTRTVPTGDGAVELAPNTGGSWASPQVVATVNFSGTVDTTDVFVDSDTAYIVSLSRSGPDFFIYNVSDPQNPLPLGSLDLAANAYSVTVSGNYAYVATSHDSREITVINISNPNSPALAGSHFNAPTSSDGRALAVSGTAAYLVTNNNTSGPGYEFYSVNITNPLSPTQLGGVNLGAASRDIYTAGNYAYIASTANTQELQVVNISNPSAPSIAGTYNSPGTSDGNSIYVVGTTAYLADAQLNILNVSNPSNISAIGFYNASGTPFGVFAVANFVFLAHTETDSQFKVIDITNPASPSLYGSASLGGNGLGVFVSGDYAYLATASNTAEFQIIQGGSGGSGYQTSGDFTSHATGSFDAGSVAAFNNLIFGANVPGTTTLRLQIAINSDNSTWVYVGPDGTSSTYYMASGSIPLNLINGRYIRYKAYFTASPDSLQTPTLNDVSINYSP